MSQIPAFEGNVNFNAQHSPMGAFMSFTCGHFGTLGGFGLQIGQPGNQDLYIGVKDGDRFSDGEIRCLPFFEGAVSNEAARYATAGPAEQNVKPKVTAYEQDQITRQYGWASDRWVTDDFKFTIFTPFGTIPDPANSSADAMAKALIPAVTAELEIDNTRGRQTKTGFFAIRFYDKGVRLLDTELGGPMRGFALLSKCGVAGTTSVASPAQLDDQLLSSGLSQDQQFMIAHATRSYYGSTQLLEVDGQPFWVVNEGEYCMMNTLDLSIDQAFWELEHNPWVVKNLLDMFLKHYAYMDQVKVYKDDGQGINSDEAQFAREFELKPGGLSFCHDMGVNNNFSPLKHSSYELPNLTGCFSYMTAEQLCNWSLLAATYVQDTNDLDWAKANVHALSDCVTSLVNRGGDVGFVQFDSSRCDLGSEITTYDSLDHSLAQTRNNVYMAVKCWASYLGLALVLDKLHHPHSTVARERMSRIEAEVLKHADADGVLPAVFERDNPGYKSRILPAVEGLMYPLSWGVEASPKFVAALRKHAESLLMDEKGRNFFEDGGIRLSSTSDNSWMSKIAIFMHVARRVFKLDSNPKIKELFANADDAHVSWQTEGKSAYWACSDQMINGVAIGSKYYPRIITAALWMDESPKG